jgi:hypothetical protein
MARVIDSALLSALAAGDVVPVYLAQLTFKSQTVYVWTGVGSFVWAGNTFTGVGRLGTIGDVTESSEIRADGTSVTLSGIDPLLLAESLTDIRPGGGAKLWFGLFTPGTRVFIGVPYLFFSGLIDKPEVHPGLDTCSITINLESRMINHSRASLRRYTTAEQSALGYPDDTGFIYVPWLNDISLNWGGS